MLIDALEPIKQNVIDLCIAVLGILSTLAVFIPKDSKLGKLLGIATKKIVSLKTKFLKK
jgi:hypothetical protein